MVEVVDVAMDVVVEDDLTVQGLTRAIAVFFDHIAQIGVEVHGYLGLAKLAVEVDHLLLDVAAPEEALTVLQEIAQAAPFTLDFELHLLDFLVLQVLLVVAHAVVGDVEGGDEVVGYLAVGIEERQDMELDIAVDAHLWILHVLAYE